MLLFYYAKTGYRIDKEVFASTKKVKAPKMVKLYAAILVIWIMISTVYFLISGV